MDGFGGMAGRQWVYLIEAAPALVLAFVVLFSSTDKPADATWLAAEERGWLVARQKQERAHREAVHAFSVKEALFNPRVLAVALIYFGANATNYGLSFFLPQIVKSFGLTNLQTGFVTSAAVYRRRDQHGVLGTWLSDRKLNGACGDCALLVAAAGIAAAAGLDNPVEKMIALSIAGFGIFGCLPVIWTPAAAFLQARRRRAALPRSTRSAISASFFGPYAMGWIKDSTGGFGAGLLCLSGAGLVGVAAVLLLHHDRFARSGQRVFRTLTWRSGGEAARS